MTEPSLADILDDDTDSESVHITAKVHVDLSLEDILAESTDNEGSIDVDGLLDESDDMALSTDRSQSNASVEQPVIKDTATPRVPTPNLQDILDESDEIESVESEREAADDGKNTLSLVLSDHEPAAVEDTVSLALMDRLTGRLSDDDVRREAGLPVAVAVGGGYIGIGSVRGIVLLFDARETLKVVLSGIKGSNFGELTALAISQTGNRVAVGHIGGHVVIWDVETREAMKILYEHNASVTHLSFVHGDNNVISVDSRGQLYHHALQKLLMIVRATPTCIVNGKFGPILDVALLPPSISGHATDIVSLAVIVTWSSCVIVALKPEAKVIRSGPKPNGVREGALPYTSWRRASGEIDVPVMAMGWGRHLSLLLIGSTIPTPEQQNVVRLDASAGPSRVLDRECECCGIAWLGSDLLGVLVKPDELHALDPKTLTTLIRLPIKETSLVHHQRFSNSLGVAESAYHNATATTAESCVLLGTSSVYVVKTVPWASRIDSLMEKGEWLDALALAVKYAGGGGEEYKVVASKLLTQYVDHAIRNQSNLRTAATACIEFCGQTERGDLLYGPVYIRLSTTSNDTHHMFLELLEPFMLAGTVPPPSPEVVQAFVSHYRKMGWLKRVEACILKMDPAALDLHQVVTLCRRHGLYRALVFALSKGLQDPSAPVRELAHALEENQESEYSTGSEAGTVLLEYLGELLTENTSAASDSLQILFDPMDALSFPLLRAVLLHDAVKFIDMIARWCDRKPAAEKAHVRVESNTSDRPDWNVTNYLKSAMGRVMSVDPTQAQDMVEEEVEVDNAPSEQAMLDAMVLVMVDVEEDPMSIADRSTRIPSTWPFSHATIAHLLMLIANRVAQGHVTCSRSSLSRIVVLLAASKDQNTAKERQGLLLAVIDRSDRDAVDQETLLMLAEDAHFNRVCEAVHLSRGYYDKALKSVLADHTRSHEVFYYVKDLIRKLGNSPMVNEVKGVVLSSLDDLVTVDADQAVKLVITFFPTHIPTLILHLESQPHTLYLFLRALLDTSMVSEMLAQSDVEIGPENHERYVELLCVYSPSDVYSYVSNHDAYRLDRVLKTVQTHGVADAMAYLLERAGDASGALKTILSMVDERLRKLRESYGGNESPTELHDDVIAALTLATTLCQRNSHRLDEEESESLWFSVLDALLDQQRGLRDVNSESDGDIVQLMRVDLAAFSRTVLQAMMGHVTLPAIVRRIVEGHGHEEFGEFRGILQAMLDTYSYELTLLETANQLIAYDTYRGVATLRSIGGHGTIPRTYDCERCGRPLTSDPPTDSGGSVIKDIAVHMCGHTFHAQCLPDYAPCTLCYGKKESHVHEVGAAEPARTTGASSYMKRLDRHLKSTEITRPVPSRLAELGISLDAKTTQVQRSERRRHRMRSFESVLITGLSPAEALPAIGMRMPGHLPSTPENSRTLPFNIVEM